LSQCEFTKSPLHPFTASERLPSGPLAIDRDNSGGGVSLIATGCTGPVKETPSKN
jgi:hypothetical protein